MTLPERVLGLVLAPLQEQPMTERRSPHQLRPASWVAVLASPADASAAAAAVALALARRARQSCALAVSWGASGESPPPAGALPAATRLARRLRESGLDAVAAGQLVRVTLDDAASSAAIAGWRALLTEGVPLAMAFAGPRCEQLDRELRGAERIVVVGASGSPAGLMCAVEADARMIGPPVMTAALRLGTATRGWLALGYGVPPRFRTALDQALR